MYLPPIQVLAENKALCEMQNIYMISASPLHQYIHVLSEVKGNQRTDPQKRNPITQNLEKC